MNLKWLLAVTALLCASLPIFGQSAHPLVQPMWHFVDETGSPCVGCHLYSYLAGTTTPTPTYTDSTGTVQNTNPIILDASGQAQIWVGSLKIKLALKHSDDSLIWTVDNILTWTNGGGSGCSVAGLAGYFLVTDGAGGCTTTQISVNGTALLAPSPINFLDSSTVHFTNPSVGTITATAAPPNNFQYQLNDTPLAGKFDPATTNPAILDFNSTLPAPPTGSQNVTWQTDSTTGRISGYVSATTAIDMQPIGLPAGQHALLYPTSVTIRNDNARTGLYVNGRFQTPGSPITESCTETTWQGVGVCTSGIIYNEAYPSSFPPALGQIVFNFTSALENEAPWINPANITNVVAFTKAGFSGPDAQTTCVGTVAGSSLITDSNLSLGSVSPDAQTCTAQISASSATGTNEYFTVALIGLAVYYTGTAPPADNSIQVALPLTYTNKTLGLDPSFSFHLNGTTIAQLPAYNTVRGLWLINDGMSSTDCTAGGNATWTPVLCYSNGSTWTAFAGGGGGGGGTYTTEIFSCSGTTGTLAHTPTTLIGIAINGLVQSAGTDFTQSGTTITFATAVSGGDVCYAQYYR